jgi:enamine deaminase RidA (YjgF/YER057c/UK114 family)
VGSNPTLSAFDITAMKNTISLLLLVVLTAVSAVAQKPEHINPAGLSKPAPGTYTHIVKVGKTLYIAGQTSVNAEGKVVGPGMKEQVEQVYSNLLTALKSQGADFSNVTKTTTYVTSIPEFRAPEVAAVRAKYVGANPPANTLVQIQSLAQPEYKVEIEAIAVLP